MKIAASQPMRNCPSVCSRRAVWRTSCASAPAPSPNSSARTRRTCRELRDERLLERGGPDRGDHQAQAGAGVDDGLHGPRLHRQRYVAQRDAQHQAAGQQRLAAPAPRNCRPAAEPGLIRQAGISACCALLSAASDCTSVIGASLSGGRATTAQTPK